MYCLRPRESLRRTNFQSSADDQNTSYQASQIDSLTAKLLLAEEQLREEKVKSKVLDEKIKQMEVDVESVPILRAQVTEMTLALCMT